MRKIGIVALARKLLIAKGPQAVFPLLFLVLVTIAVRRWRLPLRWLLSGAPITALVLGGSWWLYAMLDCEARASSPSAASTSASHMRAKKPRSSGCGSTSIV